jgi:hypothetical protein
MPSQKGGHYQTRPNRQKDLQAKYDHAKKIENQSRIVNWSTPYRSLTPLSMCCFNDPTSTCLEGGRGAGVAAARAVAGSHCKQILITLGTTPESFRTS